MSSPAPPVGVAIRGELHGVTPGSWSAVRQRVGRAIPPYPDHDVLQPVRVDNFPALDPRATVEAMVDVCCEAYRSTVSLLYGECRAFARGQGAEHLRRTNARTGARLLKKRLAPVVRDLRRLGNRMDVDVMPTSMLYSVAVAARAIEHFIIPKGWHPRSAKYDTVATGACALLDTGIPPIAWVAYACNQWGLRTHGAQRKAGMAPSPPRVTWVFDPKRVVQEADGCNASTYRRGFVWYSDLHRELVRRWEAMRDDLVRKQPMTEVDARLVVVGHFPLDDGYDAAVARVRHDYAAAQATADHLMARGTAL